MGQVSSFVSETLKCKPSLVSSVFLFFVAIVEMMAGKAFNKHGKEKGGAEAQETHEWNVFSLMCGQKNQIEEQMKWKRVARKQNGEQTQFQMVFFCTQIYLDIFEIETIEKCINKLRARRNWTGHPYRKLQWYFLFCLIKIILWSLTLSLALRVQYAHALTQ